MGDSSGRNYHYSTCRENFHLTISLQISKMFSKKSPPRRSIYHSSNLLKDSVLAGSPKNFLMNISDIKRRGVAVGIVMWSNRQRMSGHN